MVSRVVFLAICTLAFQPAAAQSIYSDNFDGSTLDANIWTMVDPLGDSVFAVGGGQLSMSVPAGQSHDAWTSQNNVARISQWSADSDIEVEVKFDSTVSQRFQLQGVLAEADADTFIRAGFYHDGSQVRAFTAFINNGSGSVKANVALGNSVAAPLYLRLKRVGDLWTHSYSLDGTTWQTAANFSQSMVLTSVSVYGGNHSSNNSAPAHTALVDYFMNLAAPLDPTYTVSTTVSGEGTVSKTPDQASYVSGSLVELTATPATGYLFDSWSGDLAGNTNPETITVTADAAVQANFVVDSTLPQYSLSVTSNGSGSVALDPPGGMYPEGSEITLTATPDSGWVFDGWSGDLVGNTNTATITITNDMVVQANFSTAPLPQYSLNVTSTGSGSVTLDPAGGVYDEGTVVTLTATPDSGWVFDGWSGDLVENINTATITITNDMVVQANFSTASLPQYSLSVTSTGAGSVTLDPAGGVYDEGTQVTLTATPDSSSIFNGWSGDLAGLTNPQTITITTDAVVQAYFVQSSGGSGLYSDNFDGSTLDANIWTMVDPLGDSVFAVGGGQLSMSVPAGQSHDAWTSQNNVARISQWSADSDIEVEVKFDSTVSQRYQLQGVLAEADADTFIRAGFYHDGSQVRAFTAFINNGSGSVKANVALGNSVAAPLYLRLKRVGDLWTHSYSLDGTTWQTAANFSQSMVLTSVSVYGGNHSSNNSAPAHTALVDYFMNLAAPLDPTYTVSTTVSGEGTVSKTPDQASYVSGSLVELTATPATGYLFDSWSGDLAGNTNPETITVTADAAVQANFVVDSTLPQYSLSVTSNGSGSVALDPPGGMYPEGSEITLTATPDSGWVFDGWSGDLVGNTSTATITITNDMVVQANFSTASLPQYSLNVTSTGSGSVTLDPAGGVYDEGTVVTLTATPDSGWVFDSWSGDLVGSINPETITVTTDMAVQANFSTEPLAQYSLSVTSNGSGSVTLDPAGGVYDEGTTVTLTAVPDSGSIFNGWSGDLAGLTNPETITVTSDAAVQAYFVQSSGGSGLYSDNFDGSTLDANVWTMVDPLGDSVFAVGGGQLSLSVPAGQSHDAWTSQNNVARIRQWSADSDIEVEVKFDSTVSQRFQLQGVLAEADADTFIRAGFYHDGSQVRAFTAFINNGSGSVKANVALGNSVAAPLYLRLKRVGDLWTHSYSLDGTTWQTAANFSQAMVLTSVSVYGGNHSSNNSAPAHTALVDYFTNLAAPIDPTYTVSTSVSGEGTVSKTPDQASYVSGSLVELTATPATGYLFDSWSGDLAGNTNPETITVTADAAVQANFVVDSTLPQYSLSVTSNGSGSVALDPPGGMYPEGSEITLTATPDSGWVFDGWSGDLVGNTSTATITITNDMVVQANFSTASLPQYSLNVTSTGSGSVTLDPAGGVYDEGTVVTLTATPDSGWVFDSWSGDLAGNTSTATITITNDMVVQANFVDGSGTGNLQLSDVQIQNTGPTSAQVTWTTNINADSRVEYGIGSVLGANASDAAMVTNHAIDIDWLKCEETYTVSVSSVSSTGLNDATVLTFSSDVCPNPGIGVAPAITLWDGDYVIVDDRGRAQRWANVRGNVATAHSISALTYSLNGGSPQFLSVGPNKERLASKGDFNVEINYEDLSLGNNELEIRAVDNEGRESISYVTVFRASTSVPSLPFSTNWSQTANVETFAYPVDGDWSIQNGRVSASTLDYDRVMALGDISWTDYEVTVPITVFEIGPHAYIPQSGAPLVGLGIRWSGHTNQGGEQPSRYWYPSGAFAWYRWGNNFELRGNDGTPLVRNSMPLTLGDTYIFKVQAATLSSTDTRYRFKVWKSSVAEPPGWQMEIVEDSGPAAGAVLIIAHHVDAHFGDIVISPAAP